MKQILLLVGLLASIVVNAQNQGIKIDDGIFLTGKQWHYEDYSILEANYNYYLVINPKEYYYVKLEDFDPEPFYAAINDSIVKYQPYVYKKQIGWFVQGQVLSYFYSPQIGVTTLLDPRIRYGTKTYYVCRKEYLDVSKWHWYSSSKPFRHNPRRRAGCKTEVPVYKPLFILEPPDFIP